MRTPLALLLACGLAVSAGAQRRPLVIPDPDARPGLADERFDFDADLDVDPAVPTPEAFLGYPTGERFAVYADVVAYLRVLAEASPRLRLVPYGTTYEGRPLLGLVAASEAHMAELEAIRRRHLSLLDPAADVTGVLADDPVVLSFSYNIHGNEASGTEAALRVAYRLAAGRDPATRALLDDAIVVLMPTINPDGRDRYVYWYNGQQSSVPSVDPRDLEHYAPWPDGRTNHYYFDLNRDWIWGVHPESRGQVELYRRWMPQIHVDVHEQGYHANYFTAPGTTPRNLYLPDAYEAWTDTFGRANIRAFDADGISYFTRDRFDFFYPGYGSSYPSVMGAVGMLTEQGGIGAGAGVVTDDGYVLSLRQRVHDHYATTFATLAAGARNREALLRYSRDAWDPRSRTAPTAAYVFPDTAETYLADLLRVLLRHGVVVERTTAAGAADLLRDYGDDAPARRTDVPAGSYVVRADQPLHLLVGAVLEPQLPIEDSVMYDMATWSAPLAYNVTAYRSPTPLSLATERVDSVAWSGGLVLPEGGRPAYAYVVDYTQRWAPRALAELHRRGYRVRQAEEPFVTQAGRRYPAGTLVVLAGRNRERADRLEADLREIAAEAPVRIEGLATGRVAEGYDLASSRNRPLVAPRVAMLVEPPFSTYTAGQAYYLFDRELRYPLTRIRTSVFDDGDQSTFGARYGGASLDDYDALILPGGSRDGLAEVFGASAKQRLRDWVRRGGTLVALEGAAEFFAADSLFAAAEVTGTADDTTDAAARVAYGERERYEGLRNIPGSALDGRLDVTHPLAFGLPPRYRPIVFGAQAITPRVGLRAVGTYAADADGLLVAGYASRDNLEAMAGQLFAAEQAIGEGSVVYLLENPHYRMFWRAGSRLVVNAVMR